MRKSRGTAMEGHIRGRQNGRVPIFGLLFQCPYTNQPKPEARTSVTVPGVGDRDARVGAIISASLAGSSSQEKSRDSNGRTLVRDMGILTAILTTKLSTDSKQEFLDEQLTQNSFLTCILKVRTRFYQFKNTKQSHFHFRGKHLLSKYL